LEKLKALFGQAVKFSLVGVVNTLLDMLIFALLTLLPLFAAQYVYAQVISYSCGVVCSLALNKLWTFKQREPMRIGQIVCFLLVNLAALGVSSGALYLYQGWGLAPLLAKVLSVPFSLGVNFVGNKLFVFKG
jgi:putative flippase GtrA